MKNMTRADFIEVVWSIVSLFAALYLVVVLSESEADLWQRVASGWLLGVSFSNLVIGGKGLLKRRP